MSEPRPLPLGYSGTKRDVQYHEYECAQCGKTERNTYCEPYRTRLLDRRLCFTCDHWREFEEKSDPTELTVIDGTIYGLGDRTTGEFRGMGGRRFDIEFVPPSVHAGKKITTFDLWCGGVLPDYLRTKFPDTARFLSGASFSGRAWDASSAESPPYPPPSSLKVKT